MNLLCDFSDISPSDQKSVRITPDKKWASVIDIIGIIGSQKKPKSVWERLQQNTEVVSKCDHFHFREGQGQRETPVITKEGVFLLINAIPGKTCAKNIISVIGGQKKCQTVWQRIKEHIEGSSKAEPSDSKEEAVIRCTIPGTTY